MQAETEATTTPLIYTLSSALNIDSAENVVSGLKALLAKQAEPLDLAIDASKVEIITTPGVQVIISLGKLLQQQGGSFSIINPSSVFVNSFTTLGLGSSLIKWSSANA